MKRVSREDWHREDRNTNIFALMLMTLGIPLIVCGVLGVLLGVLGLVLSLLQ